MTGNWYCVPNGCARVSWREYVKSPRILYRYPDQDWVTVEGDDYSIKKTYDLSDFKGYIYAYATIQLHAEREDFFEPIGLSCGKTITIRSNYLDLTKLGKTTYELNKHVNDDRVLLSLFTKTLDGNNKVENIRFRYPNQNNDYPHYLPDVTYLDDCQIGVLYAPRNRGVKDVRNIRFEGIENQSENQSDCTLTITKNGDIVHQETRDVCPEVEKQEICQLSDNWQQIKVEKINYLERVEVVPYEYKNFGLNVYQGKIPEQCLNIYNNTSTTIIPQFQGFPTPANSSQSNYGFVTQICSDLECPAPQYKVTCDCDCESCPDGTCPIICDDHVCCADKLTGKTILEIPLANYCGEGF